MTLLSIQRFSAYIKKGLDMIIKNGKVFLPGCKELMVVDIRVDDGDGKIAEICEQGVAALCSTGDDETLDAAELIILPGGIDPHVHFDDPGYTHREDFEHGTCAAASGGITTVIDMPCTSIPPIINLDNLMQKLDAIKSKAVIDYGLFGGVSAQSFEKGFPENMALLSEFVLGYKTYFISGMAAFGRLDYFHFQMALEIAQALEMPVLLHAEDYDTVTDATETAMRKGNSPMDYYHSRPEIVETIAVRKAIEIAKNVGADLHIVHVGTAEASEMLAGTDVTGETAPHYLEFDKDDFQRIGSPLKTTPPVKSPGNKERLWDMLADGSLDFVASDHAPCPESEKNTDSIWTDYAGIPGTGTLLPYMFSEGYMKGRISLRRLVEVTSEAAAKRYSIFDRKGSIEVGKDADFAIIDPNAAWIVEGKKFLSKGKITPFEGMEFKGKVVKTIVRGKVVYDSERGIIAEAGFGTML